MVRIVIHNMDDRTLEVQDPSRTLLGHLHDHHIDWMHSCGAKGRCTTCKAIILNGEENLSELTPPELRYRDLEALRPGERLACQVMVRGNVVIRVPEENKLPHLRYSD